MCLDRGRGREGLGLGMGGDKCVRKMGVRRGGKERWRGVGAGEGRDEGCWDELSFL